MDILQESIISEMKLKPFHSIKIKSQMKDVHGLMTTCRNEALKNEWVSSDDLREVKSIALDIVELCEEVRKHQVEKMERD